MTRRSRIPGACRVLALAAICCEPRPARSDGTVSPGSASAPSASSTSGAHPKASGAIPIFRSATLTGVVVEQSGSRREARLDLTGRGSELDGTIRFGDSPAFRLLEARLKLLSSAGTASDLVFGVGYGLSYLTDACEHAGPEPADTLAARRDPCFYIEGSARPRLLRRGEARLSVQKADKLWTASALGTNDVATLAAAYEVSGRAVSAGTASMPAPSSTPDRGLRAPNSATTATPKPASDNPVPIFRSATLTGVVVRQFDSGSEARLELIRRGTDLDGTIRFGDLPAFRLLEARLTLLNSVGTASDVIFRASYELSYLTDSCEHATPEPAGTQMTRWDPCFYTEGTARPRHLQPGEARLNVQRTAGTVTASALGTDGTLVSGRAQP